jgi:hypothetical protein
VRVLRVIKNGRPFRVVLNDLIPCSLRLFCLIILFGFGFGGLGWNSEMSDVGLGLDTKDCARRITDSQCN